MSNSSLVNCVIKSPNHSGHRTHAIDRITPHCVVGQLTAEGIGGCFPAGRDASCNYGIGKDGRVCLVVDECNRSWCSSSNANDQRAITIECASDMSHPYAMTNAVYQKLIALCVDICKRYGKTKLLWFGDKTKSLNYNPKSNEMVITVHRWFDNKSCPGDWLYSRLGDVASQVTAQLGGSGSSGGTAASGQMYRVRKSWSDAKSQKGAFTVLSNAKSCADQNPGYTVFDNSGKAVYTSQAGASSPSTPTKERLAVDGSFGPACVRRTQQYFGLDADGVVSNQPSINKIYLPNAYEGCWEFKDTGYGDGSNMIRALQRFVGVEADGWCGGETVATWEKCMALLGYYTGAIDSSMGPQLVKAWQRYLNAH